MHTSQLEQNFVHDHQLTTKAIATLKEAIAEGDNDQIKVAAAELDRVAGPHIAFEEQRLYPLVAKSRGEIFVSKLLQEHQQVADALQEIRRSSLSEIPDETRSKWDRDLQTGLDHVVTCGTLLSHLSVLDAPAQQRLLADLQRLRYEAPLWTELEPFDRSSAS